MRISLNWEHWLKTGAVLFSPFMVRLILPQLSFFYKKGINQKDVIEFCVQEIINIFFMWFTVANSLHVSVSCFTTHQNLPESNAMRMEETRKRNALVMQALKEAAETDDNIARGFGGSAK